MHTVCSTAVAVFVCTLYGLLGNSCDTQLSLLLSSLHPRLGLEGLGLHWGDCPMYRQLSLSAFKTHTSRMGVSLVVQYTCMIKDQHKLLSVHE